MSNKRSPLLILGICLPMLIFSLTAVWEWQKPGGIGWDETILLAIHTTRQPDLDQFAEALTELGVYKGVIPAVAVISTILLLTQRWRSLTFVVLMALGEVVLNRSAKVLIHRPRPHVWETIYSIRTDFAFPSGHAMSSMTLAIILVVLTWNTRWRWFGFVFSTLFTVGVAWTRLYLGAHYPSDIIAAWMLAVAWASLVALITCRMPIPEPNYPEIPAELKKHQSYPSPAEES